MLLSITEFLGHLHPLIVHLPIGILLIALLLQYLSRSEKFGSLKPAVSIVLLIGAISAFVSCITGYLLSTTDDYDKDLVSWHMWMGIATALVSFMLYAKETNKAFAVNKKLLFVLLLLLIMVTGHLGGSLTHGSDYLTKPLANIFSDDSSALQTIKPLQNVQEAKVYDSIVQPILETRCYACHGANKQKGGLRMNDSAALLKGGKDGIVIKTGSAENSELIKRIALSLDNEDHMPPKEKPQLTKDQVALLHWWIDNGASFNKKVKELSQQPAMKERLTALQSSQKRTDDESYVPSSIVVAADIKVLAQLKQQHILALPVSQLSNYLMVSFITDTVVTNDELKMLQQIKEQLIWLKLSNTNITNAQLKTVAQLKNITRLDVSNTAITDAGIVQLDSMKNLQYLNLVNTGVTDKGISALRAIKSLRQLYLYKTSIDKNKFAALQQQFPATVIDTGGYVVATLQTDTTIVKEKKAY